MSNGDASTIPVGSPVELDGIPASAEFAQADQLLRSLFLPTDNVLFRLIEAWIENGKKKARTLWKQTQCRAAATVSEISISKFNEIGAAERANIFFGVAPRVGGDGFDYAWQIRVVRCLWADVDDVSPEGAIARCLDKGLPRPSIVVASGTIGGHLYWLTTAPYLIDDVGPPPRVRKEWIEIGWGKKPIHFFDDATGQRVYLDDPATGRKLEHPKLSDKAMRLRNMLQGIAASIGGDHTIDPTRLLRLPGTMNRKDERNGRQPRPCELIECNGERYDIGLFERFAEVKSPGKKRRSAKSKANAHVNLNSSAKGFVPGDAAIIKRISDSKQGEKFGRLMAGDTSDYAGDESRADEALCCMMAYWIRDAATIDRIFRTSELCDEKWTSRPDYRDSTIGKALELVTEFFDWSRGKGKTQDEKPAPQAIQLTEQFSLLAVDPRRSPSGKITVTVKLLDGGKPVLRFDVSSCLSSQKEAVKKLTAFVPVDAPKAAETPATVEAAENPEPPEVQAQAVPEAPQIDLGAIVGKIIIDAEQALDDEAAAKAASEADDEDLESVRDIVFHLVPEKFDLRYRTTDGKAWSEKWGRAVSRQEFISHVPAQLVDAAQAGHDAEIEEPKHVRAVQSALGVLWSSLMDALPLQAADADLSNDSEDARRMRRAVIRLWTKPVLLKNVPIGNGKEIEAGQVRASLASLVEEAFRPYTHGKQVIGPRESWRPIRTAVAAWWRPWVDSEGQVVPLLAMRFDLFDHLGIPVDGVTDQASLRRLGVSYGIFSDSPGVTDRMTGGCRLAVLTHEIKQEILSQPTNEPEEPTFSDSEPFSDSDSGVTEEISDDQQAGDE